MIALVIGGARSGKSRYAASVAEALSPAPVMVATSRAFDDDHAARIRRHKVDRGSHWITIEEETAIARPEIAGRVAVVDCVTLWVTNLFLDLGSKLEPARDAAAAELERLFKIDATVLFVTNELGMSLHAPTEVGRKFVDLQGFVNQQIAARADGVTLMVAGIPLAVKGGDLRTLLAKVRRA
jgi:adenosylcobinamide kinase/adenosylcobinamide-phosphate guanylyltransferase